MILFLFALAIFLALHSVPAIPAIRQNLIALMGRRAYLASYSLASIFSLAFVFHAAFQLDHVELWPPAAWQAFFPIILTPIAFFLLIAGLASPNPLSISVRRGETKPGAIIAVTRHPALWGFFLWSLGHIVANGDLRSLILFGVFALFSLFGIVMAERRTRKRADKSLNALVDSTSIIPFAASLRGQSRLGVDMPMIAAFLVSAILTAWMLLGGHAALFGADPLAMTAI